MTHEEQTICLKEKEWREVRDFIIGTGEYRIHLDRSIQVIINILSGIAIAVLIPSIILWINVGEMKRQISINTDDVKELQKIEGDAQSIRASNVARISALENMLK